MSRDCNYKGELFLYSTEDTNKTLEGHMKKKLITLALTAMMILGVTACGNKDGGEKPVDVAIPVDTIVQDLEKELEFGMMMKLDAETLKQFYNLDASLFEEHSANFPMMNVQANEYSVFKLKDEKDLDTVKEALKVRAETVQKTFEFYLEDQYKNAKNYYLDSNGKYVIFVIHEDVDKAKTLFQNYFK